MGFTYISESQNQGSGLSFELTVALCSRLFLSPHEVAKDQNLSNADPDVLDLFLA